MGIVKTGVKMGLKPVSTVSTVSTIITNVL